MSGPGAGSLRLRLFFDYPPPSTPESCQCWLLLDLSRCRVVTDLSCLIRGRFGFSPRARLSLYLQDCLLPPCESIGVVRDNDSIRVKLEEVDTFGDTNEVENDVIHSPKRANKRSFQEQEKEEEPQRKKKKKKQDIETSLSPNLHLKPRELTKKSKKRTTKPEVTRDSSSEGKEASIVKAKKQKKKKKERNQKIESNKNTAGKNSIIAKGKKAMDASESPGKICASKKGQLETNKKVKRDSESDSSSSSSLSSNTASKLKLPLSKSTVPSKKKDVHQPKAGAATTDTAAKNPAAPKTGFGINPVKTVDPSSSDSDSNKEVAGGTVDKKSADSNKEVAGGMVDKKSAAITIPSAVDTSPLQPQKKKGSSSSDSSDSSDSDSFVIKKTKPGLSAAGDQDCVGNGDKQTTVYGPALNPRGGGRGVGRGIGRGEDAFPWRGHRGRGFRGRVRVRGRGDINPFDRDYYSDSLKQQQLNHSVTNGSVVIENPPETPKQDYSTMPLLAAPPQVGQKIAFKLLELTENYTPEVSEYKEGKIIAYSPVTQQLDLEVLSASEVVKGPGKFDLVYESSSGARTIEYAVPQDTKITKSWTSLIEPRLIVETWTVPAVSTTQGNTENVIVSP